MLLRRLQTQKDSALSWVVCLTGALFFFYDFFQLMMFNTLNTELSAAFNLSPKWLGYLSSAFLLSNTLLLFPAGIAVNRYSTRRIILCMLAISVGSSFGFAYATAFLAAWVSRLLEGVAHAFCFLCCAQLVRRWFSPSKQGFVMGVVVMIGMLGGAVAQKPLAMLTERMDDWRYILKLNAWLGVAIWLLVALLVEDGPASTQAAELTESAHYAAMPFLETLKRVVRNRQNWWYGLYTGLLNLPIMVLGALWGNRFLTSVHAVTAGEAATASSLLYLGSLVGAPLVGVISDRWGHRKLPMALGGATSLLLSLLLVGGQNFPASWIAVLFFVLGLVSSTQVLSYPCISALNEEAVASTAMGLSATLIMGLGGLSQPFVGALIQWHRGYAEQVAGIGGYGRADFAFGLAVLPVAILIALAALQQAQEPFASKKNPK